MRLIHDGRGNVLVVEEREFIDPTTTAPKVKQRPAYRPPPRLDCFKPLKNHNGYRPGPLLDLGPDQCRAFIDAKRMCGAKVEGHSSWCAHHRAQYFVRRAR